MAETSTTVALVKSPERTGAPSLSKTSSIARESNESERTKINPLLDREYTAIGVGTTSNGEQPLLYKFKPSAFQPLPQVTKVEGRTVLQFGAENTAGGTPFERFAVNNTVVARLLGIDLSQLSPKEAEQKLQGYVDLLGLKEPSNTDVYMALHYTEQDGKERVAFVPLYNYDPNRDLQSVGGRGSLGMSGGGLGVDYRRQRVDGSGYRAGLNGNVNGNGVTVGVDGGTWWRDRTSTHQLSGGVGLSPSGPFGGVQYGTTDYDKYGQFEQRYGVDAGVRASGPSVRVRYANRDVSVDAGVNSLGGLPLTGVLVRTAGRTPDVMQSNPNRQWATPNGEAPLSAGIVVAPGVPTPVPFIVPQMYPKEVSMTQQEAEAADVRQISEQLLRQQERYFTPGLSERVRSYVQRFSDVAQARGYYAAVEFPPATIGAHVLPTSEYASGRFSSVIKNFEEATGITIVKDGKVAVGKEEIQTKLQDWFVEKNGDFWRSLSSSEQQDVKELLKRYVEPLPVPTFQQLREDVNKGIRQESYRQRYVDNFEVDGKVKVTEEVGKDGVTYAIIRTSIGVGLTPERRDDSQVGANMEWYRKEEKKPLSPDLRVAQQQLQSFRRSADEEKRSYMNQGYNLLSRSVNGRTDLQKTLTGFTAELENAGFTR